MLELKPHVFRCIEFVVSDHYKPQTVNVENPERCVPAKSTVRRPAFPAERGGRDPELSPPHRLHFRNRPDGSTPTAFLPSHPA